ncbi:ABC transporter permease [Bifidobacterium thermacidophilum]
MKQGQVSTLNDKKRHTRIVASVVIPLISICIALGCFVAFALAQGASLEGLYAALYYGVLANPNFLTQTMTRSVPLICAALAVIVPARSGLVNVGGEGQLIIGAVAGTGVAVSMGDAGVGIIGIIIVLLSGALAGGAWGYLCAVLKTAFHAPETVSTLLANFIAADIMLYLLYSPWKDPDGSGQPQSKPIAADLRITTTVGIPITFVIVIVIAMAVWALLNKSKWGFAARVVGSNPVAAFRGGLSVSRYAHSAMLLGGALAGLGGALNVLGAEGQLRPGLTTTFGFIAFLAAFIAGTSIWKGVMYSIVAAAVLVGSNPLQLRAGLDGNASYVLLGVTCLAIVVISRKTGRAS